MTVENDMLYVLRHDLHKVVTEAIPHNEALIDPIAQKADSTAAWLSRNFLEDAFDVDVYRKSLIYPTRNLWNPRTVINHHRQEINTLFQEENSHKLHELILQSKLLNLYSEARSFPFTSLKYHILLVTALYYNFSQGYKLKELYLCENANPETIFQIIYKDETRDWAILPSKQKGMSRLYSQFYLSWERRMKLSLGGDYRALSGILTNIRSWTIALATIEDFMDMINL